MDTVNTKMTALADEIRELSGTTEKLGIDEMTSALDTENTNFNLNLTMQSNLIEQIKSALVGKGACVDVEIKLQDKIVTPTTSAQNITADSGYDGLSSVIVAGDENLVSKNIVNGVSIFGIQGSATSGGSDNTNTETCSVQITTNNDYAVIYSTIGVNNLPTIQYTTDRATLEHVICNSYIFIPVISTLPGYQISGNVEFIEMLSGYSQYRIMVFKITTPSGQIASITCFDDD